MQYFLSITVPLFCFLLVNYLSQVCGSEYGTKLLNANTQLSLDKYDDAKKVLIVDLKRGTNSMEKFDLLCLSGPESVELNISFSGVRSMLNRADENTDATGRRRVHLTLEPPLLPELTGRYTCSARYKNGAVETVSWYVYFYPGDGSLFVKCPLFGKIAKCLVFYRINIPFVIPCKCFSIVFEIQLK